MYVWFPPKQYGITLTNGYLLYLFVHFFSIQIGQLQNPLPPCFLFFYFFYFLFFIVLLSSFFSPPLHFFILDDLSSPTPSDPHLFSFAFLTINYEKCKSLISNFTPLTLVPMSSIHEVYNFRDSFFFYTTSFLIYIYIYWICLKFLINIKLYL